MECKIPVRSFAIAAAEASSIFKCNPENAFCSGSHASTRARNVAVAAMIQVFPKAKRISIAQGFNLRVEAEQVTVMLKNARGKPWWSDDYVSFVADAIKQDLRNNHDEMLIEFDSFGNIEFIIPDDDAPVLKKPEPEIVATRYSPRRWTPARIIRVGAARPKNVTGALLGDPPAGRREMLASMPNVKYPGSYARQGE